jgi:hypothetical protein
MITDGRVRRLYRLLAEGMSLAVASRRTGMDKKTARKHRDSAALPSELVKRRTWRTRQAPFAEVWAEVEAKLEAEPKLRAFTLVAWLQGEHPKRFPDSQRRMFEWRVRRWLAAHGPHRKVMFPQVHGPSDLAAFYHDEVLLGRDTDGNDGWSISVSMAGRERGEHTLSARAQDDSGATNSWSESVSVTITVINLAPTTQGDDYAAAENEPLVVDNAAGVLANDDDADDRELTVELVKLTRHGGLVLNEDGSFIYTPDLNFNREDSFQYRASNGLDVSDPVTVTITMETVFPWHNGITPVNVNDNVQVAPLDALLIINELNRNGIHLLPVDKPRPLQEPFYDVDRNGMITPNDALLVINHLHRNGITDAKGEGEAANNARLLLTPVDVMSRSQEAGDLSTDNEFASQEHLHEKWSIDIPTGLPSDVPDDLRVWMRQNEKWTNEDLEEILEEIVAGGDGSVDL